MRKPLTLTALLFVVLTSSLWGDFNPSSGFLDEPILRDTEVEFYYVSTYNGLNMTATSPYYIFLSNKRSGDMASSSSNCYEFIFKLDSLDRINPLVEQIIFVDSTSTYGYSIFVSDSNKVSFQIFQDSLILEGKTSSVFNDSTWYYITINNRKFDAIEIFINGAIDCSYPLTDSIFFYSDRANPIIGKSIIDTTYFCGRIADIRFSNTSKDSFEIIDQLNNNYYFEFNGDADLIYHFDSVNDSILDYSHMNTLGFYIGNADSLNNAFFSNKPNFYEWDINADGVYDTTTTEQTLVYDYGSYDTTKVIVKAVFDSTTFNIDTTQIALFENIISLNYDTLWVCTLATENFNVLNHPFSVSDSGEAAAVRVSSPTHACTAHYLIHKGNAMLFDSSTTVSVLHNGSKFVVAKEFVDTSLYLCVPRGCAIVDTNNIRNDFFGYVSLYSRIAKNDSTVLCFKGGHGYADFDHFSWGLNTNNLLSTCTTEGTVISIIDSVKQTKRRADIKIQKNLDFFVKCNYMASEVVCMNVNGDTLWTRNNLFTPSNLRYTIGTQQYISDSDSIYLLIGYSTDPSHPEGFWDDVSVGMNVLVICLDKYGVTQWEYTLTNVKTGHLFLTNDGKYLFGVSTSGEQKTSYVGLWDMQTKTNIFQNSIPNTTKFSELTNRTLHYNQEIDELFIELEVDQEHQFILDKKGNFIINSEPEKWLFNYNSNLAYEKDENRLIMYRVEWEPPSPPLPPSPSPSQ